MADIERNRFLNDRRVDPISHLKVQVSLNRAYSEGIRSAAETLAAEAIPLYVALRTLTDTAARRSGILTRRRRNN